MAATMPGYAPHRQMLPLIASRTSSSLGPHGSLHHRGRRHDLSRRAVAALEAVVIDECLLHRMERVPGCAGARGEPLDRRDRLALLHHRERQAGQDATAVDVHGARAALPVIAALLGAGDAGVLAQCVEQRDARFEVE